MNGFQEKNAIYRWMWPLPVESCVCIEFEKKKMADSLIELIHIVICSLFPFKGTMFLFLFGLSSLYLTGLYTRKKRRITFKVGGCIFDWPLLGEYYSYEDGLETSTSLKENGDIERRFYRRESGAGATRKDSGGLLVRENIGQCFQLHLKQNYFQIICRDK